VVDGFADESLADVVEESFDDDASLFVESELEVDEPSDEPDSTDADFDFDFERLSVL
jgi:hypothetical protein